MNRIERLQRHQTELRRGMTLIKADLLDLPAAPLAREIEEVTRYAEHKPAHAQNTYLRARSVNGKERYDRVGRILMSALESFGMAQELPGDIEEGFCGAYAPGSSLYWHEDGNYYGGEIIRITWNVLGHGTFRSPVTGDIETAPGDMLVQDLTRPIGHEVLAVHDDRLVAIWDIPGRVS